MEEFKKQFEEHVAQDAEEFKLINSKLDQLLGQWKLVGAAVGILSGIIGTIAAALLGG